MRTNKYAIDSYNRIRDKDLPQAVDILIVNTVTNIVQPRASIVGRKPANQYVITVNNTGSINKPGIWKKFLIWERCTISLYVYCARMRTFNWKIELTSDIIRAM